MPIYDLGYRSWKGKVTPIGWRWWVLAQMGIALAWRNRWLRRFIVFAWMPALYFGGVFFAYEYFVKKVAPHQQIVQASLPKLGFSLPDEVVTAVATDPAKARPIVWSFLLSIFFRYPQVFLLVMIVGMVAPTLISQDLRDRTYLLYFSRPLTLWEYILGKSCVVFFYLSLITTVPAIALYLFAIILSPSFGDIIIATWFLPVKIILASVILMIPTTALALAFSSMTMESKYAQFSWYAMWILGWVAFAWLEIMGNDATFVSLYHTLGIAQKWAFGVQSEPALVPYSFTILAILTALAATTIYRRVAAPLNV